MLVYILIFDIIHSSHSIRIKEEKKSNLLKTVEYFHLGKSCAETKRVYTNDILARQIPNKILKTNYMESSSEVEVMIMLLHCVQMTFTSVSTSLPLIVASATKISVLPAAACHHSCRRCLSHDHPQTCHSFLPRSPSYRVRIVAVVGSSARDSTAIILHFCRRGRLVFYVVAEGKYYMDGVWMVLTQSTSGYAMLCTFRVECAPQIRRWRSGVDTSSRCVCLRSIALNCAARETIIDTSCASCVDWSLRECTQLAQQEVTVLEARNVLHLRVIVLQSKRYYLQIVSVLC